MPCELPIPDLSSIVRPNYDIKVRSDLKYYLEMDDGLTSGIASGVTGRPVLVP